jgi:pre-mRNA-splicing factor CWC26
MPSANLAAYLAKNYLNASNARGTSETESPSSDFQDSTRPKKKRRKNKDDPATGLVVADDDEELSINRPTRDRAIEEDTPTFDTGVKSAEFRKKKGGSGWKVVSQGDAEPGTASAGNDDAAAAEADRILAEAAEESRLRRKEIDDEDAPAIVEDVDTDGPRMQSGAKAGLQTAADTAALVAQEEREQELERQKSSSRRKKHKEAPDAPEEETIYRDATGRRIDVSLKRAEIRAAAEEKARAERKAREDAMGDVQLRQKAERKKELEEAKFLTLGRSADDEVMNEELKERVRWDDPMAAYMAQTRAEQVAEERGSAVATRGGKSKPAPSGPRKKVYTGPPAAPNRYGILPGWRWDGVDRSNGFEKDWFQARSKKGRMEELSYQWQMDE